MNRRHHAAALTRDKMPTLHWIEIKVFIRRQTMFRMAISLVAATYVLCGIDPSTTRADDETRFWDVAKPFAHKAGMPLYGDVVFSIRWNRGRCNLDHAKQFHANRIEWSYINDFDWAKQVRAEGYALTGAVNTSLPDVLVAPGEERKFTIGRVVSKDGSDQSPEHLKAMGHRVGCFNRPAFRNLFVDRAKQLAAAGVIGIHVDGPTGSWGDVVAGRSVCFCNDCTTIAKQRRQDINDQQTRSLIQRYGLKRVYKMAQEETRKINPDIVWTKNVHKPLWFESMFDYEFAELDPEDGIEPSSFLALRKRKDEPDRFQIYTLRSDNVRMNQETIALAYATGSLVSAPYDIYPADGYKTGKRYYGKHFHYSPQYAMARFLSQILNDYEDAFRLIANKADKRWAQQPVTLKADDRQALTLFARAKPNQPDAGVVFHLLHRSSERRQATSTIQIRQSSLRPLDANLEWTFYRLPEQYDAAAHGRAETDAVRLGNEDLASPACYDAYAPLVEKIQLQATHSNGQWVVELPPFRLHGVLHVAPAK